MSKEKSNDNSRGTGKKTGKRFGNRRENYVDSFRWGFVEGTEDDRSEDDEKSETENRKSGKDKIDENKGKRRVEKKAPKKTVKKLAENLPLFAGEDDDDDLNLPSYGRTPVPKDDELPKAIPVAGKSPRKNAEPSRKAPEPKRDSGPKKAEKSFFEKDDSPKRETMSANAARPRKEQMVWDPDKREYVPLVVPERIEPKRDRSRSSKKMGRENSTDRDDFREKESAKTDSGLPKRFETETESPEFSDGRPDSLKKKRSRSRRKKSVREPDVRTDRIPEKDGEPEAERKVDARSQNEKRGEKHGEKRGEKRRDERGERGKNAEIPVKTPLNEPIGSTKKDSKRSFEKRDTKKAESEKSPETPDSLKKGDRPSESSGERRPRDGKARRPQRRGDVPPMVVETNLPDPADVESEVKGFAELGVSDEMLEALKIVRYLEPTPIQSGVFKQLRAGKDVMGQAQTGTGKTAAFSIPIIEGVEECPPGNDPVALILVPTRELAVQVRDEVAKLSYGRDIRTTACYGGKPIAKQISRLKEGVDIIVGTPGRILDLMNRRALSLDTLRWVVLDEADRMLDIGFRPDIEKILRKTPKERQTLLFSATLPAPVVRLAEKYMNEPEVLDFSNKGVAVDTIEQFYITVDPERKFDALVHLLNEEQPHQAIIFTRTKRGADRLARLLSKRFENLAAIHGDLSQGERDRVMGQFRTGKLRYLVATDVVGRGIDVSGISHIINFDIPAFCDDYVHRVGRTGRMGREGVAFTFVTVQEGAELTRIEMRIEKLLKRADLKGFESFAKPVDTSDGSDDDDSPTEAKPVYGKSVRKIRRAL